MPDAAAHREVRENRRLLLLGGGGHARVVADAARLAGWQIAGFVDDDRLAPLSADARWLGPLRDWTPGGPEAPLPIVAVGALPLRRRLLAGLSGCATVVHPRAVVSSGAALEEGVFIGPGAIVNAGARIRAHAIINSGAIVEHDCDIGENAHIAPACALGGEVRIGADTLVGIGSRVLPGRRIGARAVVGGASLVREDVDDGQMVLGVPARLIQPASS